MSVMTARSDTDPAPATARRGRAVAAEEAGLSVRLLPATAIEALGADIADLAKRSLARNVFYEGAFLVHAAHHLRDDGRPQIAMVWRGAELAGLFPLFLPRFAAGAAKARGWLSHYMMDGAPLIDSSCAEATLRRLLAWLAEGDRPVAGVVFPSIEADGPFAALLRSVAARDGLALAAYDPRMRAVLRPHAAGPRLSKRRKELQRQARRLGDQSEIFLRHAVSRAEVRDAFEHFLAIEARGWKGRAGTAMMQDPAAAAFGRSMTRAMAGEGRCRIDLLERDGTPIAATVEILAGDRAYFWKTAYDERLARYSPGVQLAQKLTERHLSERDAEMVDSCAEEGHPMIDRLWPQRMPVADFFIGASPQRARAAGLVMAREKILRGARAAAKRAYRAIRKR